MATQITPRPMPPKLRKATPEEKRQAKIEKLYAKRGEQRPKPLRMRSVAKSRPNRMSRAEEERQYLKDAKPFKEALLGTPCPVAWQVAREVRAITDVHHMAGREGKLLLDKRHWLGVSRWGHDWIRDNPNEARGYGWLYEVDENGNKKGVR